MGKQRCNERRSRGSRFSVILRAAHGRAIVTILATALIVFATACKSQRNAGTGHAGIVHSHAAMAHSCTVRAQSGPKTVMWSWSNVGNSFRMKAVHVGA